MATHPTPLRDITKVIRSKNAGPFEITLDIVFKTKEDFEAVKKSGVITKELVSQLYNVPTQNIITFGFFDLVNAVKITLPRPRAQGATNALVNVPANACASLFRGARLSCAEPAITPSSRPTTSRRSGTSSTPFQ